MRDNMKTFFAGVAIALLTGCATSESVVKQEGQGVKRTFAANTAKVWPLAVAASKHGELSLVSVDPTRGLIVAKTGVRMESWGERVAIWVRAVDDSHAEVEVVSGHAGPTGLWNYEWTDQIMNDIASDLGEPLQPPRPRPALNAGGRK